MPHGETASDKMSFTGADHRARAPQNLCCWRVPLAACWENNGLMVRGWLRCLFSQGCCPGADTAAFATSGLVAQRDSSHENLDLKVVVSVDVLETLGS